MKHTLVLIGYTGGKQAYLDVPRDEAIRRHQASGWSFEPSLLDEFEFTDEFSVYDAWKSEP